MPPLLRIVPGAELPHWGAQNRVAQAGKFVSARHPMPPRSAFTFTLTLQLHPCWNRGFCRRLPFRLWALLELAPTPQRAAKLTEKRLQQPLAKHRIRLDRREGR